MTAGYAGSEPGHPSLRRLAIEYVDYLPPEFFDIWTRAEREWARQLYASEHFTKVRTKYIDIESQLREEPRGSRRTQLVDKAADLKRFEPDL